MNIALLLFSNLLGPLKIFASQLWDPHLPRAPLKIDGGSPDYGQWPMAMVKTEELATHLTSPLIIISYFKLCPWSSPHFPSFLASTQDNDWSALNLKRKEWLDAYENVLWYCLSSYHVTRLHFNTLPSHIFALIHIQTKTRKQAIDTFPRVLISNIIAWTCEHTHFTSSCMLARQ